MEHVAVTSDVEAMCNSMKHVRPRTTNLARVIATIFRHCIYHHQHHPHFMCELQLLLLAQLAELFILPERDYVDIIVDIIDVLNRQKNGKAVGPDNIAMEALTFGGHRLYVHICLLFNLFIKHCYIPTAFMQSLVKSKSGNLSDKDNYRVIAISTAISKVF